jgi:outer membrane protein, multidrug efflux system
MRSLLARACLLGLWLASAPVLAQVDTPRNAPLAATSATPELPEVSDPMLTPIAPPTRVLGSWRQAIELVRARSTDLGIARARIAQAEGQTRLTRSGLLPQLTAGGRVDRELLLGHVNGATAAGVVAEVSVPDPATTWNASVSLSQPLVNARAWYDMVTSATAVKAAAVQA